jgi:hypothetical protein
MDGMDESLSELQQVIDKVTHGLIRELPGVAFDDTTEFRTKEQAIEFLANPVLPQLIYIEKLLCGLRSNNQEWSSQRTIPSSLSQSRLMERQLWRLQDLCNGAFGFTLELYFLSIRKILLKFPSSLRRIHQIVLVKTFETITCDWEAFTDSIGTRQIIINIVFDIAFRGRGIFSDFSYPDYITKKLLELLGGMIAGKADVYIGYARSEICGEDLTVFDSQFLINARETLLGKVAL